MPFIEQDFGHDVLFALQTIDASGSVLSFATTTISIPPWLALIQTDDSLSSISSWYDDNWYNLGTGFYGTIKSLTFHGAVNTNRYPQFPAHLWLQEFLDPDYTQLNQTFTISDNAPFTNQIATVAIGGLNIPLQSNKYYRLATFEQLQNQSVVLQGTQATGTAMWDEFVNGTGIVRHTYPFYPYLTAIMIPNYPPLAPPNPPASLSFSFDQFGLTLGVAWPAAIDPDTTANLLTYQFNVSTSSALDDSGWQSMGTSLNTSISLVFNDAYTIGVRAIDDFGNIGIARRPRRGASPWVLCRAFSAILLASEPGFYASGQHDSRYWRGIAFSLVFLPPIFRPAVGIQNIIGARSIYRYGISSSPGGAPAYIASADGLNQGYSGCQGSPVFTFDSAAPQLLPNHLYRWVFNMKYPGILRRARRFNFGARRPTLPGER